MHTYRNFTYESDEKTKLSEEGQELKKLIRSGHRKREAHTPHYDPAVLKKPNMARWTGKTKFLSTTNYKFSVASKSLLFSPDMIK